MSTINYKIKVLNQEKSGYDTYHVETNSSQVYDFSRSKWLSEVINDIESRITNIGSNAQIDQKISDAKDELRAYIDSEIDNLEILFSVTSETFTSTEGQTEFTLSNTNNLSTDFLEVQLGGVEQFIPDNCTKVTDEQGVTKIVISEPLPEGVELRVEYFGGIDAVNTVMNGHINDSSMHVTQEEKDAWNSKSDFSGDYNDLTNKPTIPTLNNTVTSTSETEVATANAVRLAYDKAQQTSTQVTNHLSDYEYRLGVVVERQLRLTSLSTVNRIPFYLTDELSDGTAISISLDDGVSSMPLLDIEGNAVTSLPKGFGEVVLSTDFFTLVNKGGSLTKEEMQALIDIVNEAEENESVLRTNYINAVNGADSNISLPSTATWNDILLQIPNINASRPEFYEGVTTIENHKTVSLGYANGNAVSVLCAQIDVNVLGFIPDIIIGHLADNSNTTTSMWFSYNFYQSSTTVYANAYNWSQSYRAPKVGDIINLPLANGSSSQPFKFYAFKFN